MACRALNGTVYMIKFPQYLHVYDLKNMVAKDKFVK